MDHREQMSNTPSNPDQVENKAPDEKMRSLLEQCNREMQKAGQLFAEMQAQFELTQQCFQALRVEITRHDVPPSPIASTLASPIEAPPEMPASEPVYPTYGLYAYGLVEKSPHQPLDIVGIDKKNKVFAIKGNDLCVIVSEINISQFQEQVKNLYAALSQTPGMIQNQQGEILQAHEHVIDTIMQHTTIVPLKFGTILKDEQAAQTLLAEQGERFKSLLATFQGKVECGLKIYVDKRLVLQQMMHSEHEYDSSQPLLESRSKGAAYLLARKKEEQLKDRVNAELLHVADHIFHTFGQAACDMKQNSPLPAKTTGKKKEMILNAAYLVEQEQVAAFYEQAKSLAAHYASIKPDLEFSGPWPPYNFM